jgi:hypothetical protein
VPLLSPSVGPRLPIRFLGQQAALVAIAAAASGAMGCSSASETEEPESDAETEALVSNEEAQCPAHTDLNIEYRLCENEAIAVGPFPRKMVEECERRGAAFCKDAYWTKTFAHDLRGTEYCPPGTTLDEALGVCTDGDLAYGPFSQAMIDFCRTHGGGPECFAMEWRKEWTPTPSDNEQDATPGEITPPVKQEPGASLPDDDPTCHLAQGYRAGKPFTICVTMVDGELVERDTARAVRKMQDAARKKKIGIRVVSGFRTMGKQRELYRLYKSGRGALAATPGYSNHQRGTALDLNTRSPGVYAWLAAHAHEFGFRRTVPSEKWHWEYVGGDEE